MTRHSLPRVHHSHPSIRGAAVCRALAGACAVAALAPHAAGQCEQQILFGSEVGVGDEFGQAVAMSGSTVVVGAYLDDELGANAGAAYVFRREATGDTWVQDARLLAPDGASDDQFGLSVATDAGRAIVGAPRHDAAAGNAGAAYVFRYAPRQGLWALEAKLMASDAAVADLFGTSVSISGGVAVVGAHLDDDLGTESGSAYVFRYDDSSGTWSQEAKLLPSDGAVRDRFGWSVSASGNAVLVGAYQDDDNGSNSGAAYIFRHDASDGSWYEEFKLVPADGDAADRFGFAAALRGNVALVGAYLDNDLGADSGSAYLFQLDAPAGVWIEHAKLVPADGAAMDFFGRAVALGSGVALVGAPRDDDLGVDSGSAYLYEFVGAAWSFAAKILATPSQADDRFGFAAGVGSDAAVVGARFADHAGTQSGGAYLFGDLHPTDCNDNMVADGCDIALGTSLDDDGDGMPDECVPIPGDLDGDGIVGLGDLQNLVQQWGPCPPDGSACPGDLDGDGVVGILDLLMLLGLM